MAEDLLPFSRGWISVHSQLKIATPFPNTMSVFPIKKTKKLF